ncbi:site-specific integrase [Fulvimarina sp. 2208YS6-2-32]|uniref:Site-specific integrase n=1 Tax=Fulvimarina uroteuthidis TaxID=3098149 RepID=A0ABU5I2C0_9HYPH|nr:site-specific integrase [Fulvimarina sp. 2208YS6-2-32]MDY8108306.1 site-specific integrase [Fulvimarina sp. 2208YS6-2-32]
MSDGATRRSWVIRDGQRFVRTGCPQSEIARAEGKLAEYLGQKHEPKRQAGKSSELLVGDILMIYATDRAPATARPKETLAAIGRLEDFWGEMTAAEIVGANCRAFTAERGTQSGARRDLEILRAAVKYYKGEIGMEYEPVITLPDKSRPRHRWLTRSEAARLLWACLRPKESKTAIGASVRARRRHLARFVLIGLYTATRHEAITGMQWHPNTVSGWFDLEAGVMYRRGAGVAETNKRRPPARIPDRLMAHLRRWRRMDSAGATHVCAIGGEALKRVSKAFRRAREDAGLDLDVKPHSLRHTGITWLVQAGVDPNEVSGFAGVTIQEMQRTYLHHHSDFQTGVAGAKMRKPAKRAI